MKIRRVVQLMVVFCLIFAASMAFAADVKKYRVLYHTAKVGTFWPSTQRVFKAMEEMSDNKLQFTIYGAGELARGQEVFQLVSSGSMKIGTDWPGYWSGVNTAFDLFASQVMGLSPEDFMMWIWNGGGFELMQEVYGKYNLVYLPYSISHMECGIRSKKKFSSMADLKGKKIRIGGLVAGKVIQKFGAVPTMISPAELYEAARRGTIDGFEFSGPEGDMVFKLYEVSKYWMTPGWHQVASIHGILVNKKEWDKLPKNLQTIMKHAARSEMAYMYGGFVKADMGAVDVLASKTEMVPLSKADLAQIETYANEIKEDLARKNPDYAKVLKSQMDWLKGVANYRKMLGDFDFGRTPDYYPQVD